MIFVHFFQKHILKQSKKFFESNIHRIKPKQMFFGVRFVFCFLTACTSQAVSHLEKVKERHMFDQRPIETLVVFEEEEVGEGSVDHVGVCPGKLHQLQTLLATVPPSPEGRSVLLGPRGSRIRLH